MKHLYQAAVVNDVTQRIAQLQPDSKRAWGKMNPAQALAHCTAGFDMAMGKFNPPRMLIGRVFGRVAKQSMIVRGEPMRRNSPTTKQMFISGDRDFTAERERLLATIDRFVAAGPEGCTKHPHTFFGSLTPVEWATLMYQHLDHHLRQFQV